MVKSRHRLADYTSRKPPEPICPCWSGCRVATSQWMISSKVMSRVMCPTLIMEQMDMMLQVNLIFNHAQLRDIKTMFICPPRWLWSKRKQSILKISCQLKINMLLRVKINSTITSSNPWPHKELQEHAPTQAITFFLKLPCDGIGNDKSSRLTSF